MCNQLRLGTCFSFGETAELFVLQQGSWINMDSYLYQIQRFLCTLAVRVGRKALSDGENTL